jgi:hypothetical protein
MYLFDEIAKERKRIKDMNKHVILITINIFKKRTIFVFAE